MAHTGIFATSSEILTKAGENYDTSVTEAKINELCLQAESFINVATRYNWTDAWQGGGLNADVKYILSMLESDLVAMYMISYNMAGYLGGLTEAQTMLNVLNDRVRIGIEVLKTKDNQDFLIGA